MGPSPNGNGVSRSARDVGRTENACGYVSATIRSITLDGTPASSSCTSRRAFNPNVALDSTSAASSAGAATRGLASITWSIVNRSGTRARLRLAARPRRKRRTRTLLASADLHRLRIDPGAVGRKQRDAADRALRSRRTGQLGPRVEARAVLRPLDALRAGAAAFAEWLRAAVGDDCLDRAPACP